MLLPTMLPTPISVCFLAIAITDVINSGSDVPIPTIITPITNWERPKLSATATAPLTVKCPPRNNRTIPIPINANALGSVSILYLDRNNSPSTCWVPIFSVFVIACVLTVLIV